MFMPVVNNKITLFIKYDFGSILVYLTRKLNTFHILKEYSIVKL